MSQLDRVIVYERPGGHIRVRHLLASARRPGESDDELMARESRRNVPDDWPRQIVPASRIPSRRFRAAWRWTDDGISIDLNAARGIVLAEVREERDRRLLQSDSDKARIDEIGTPEEKEAIVRYRQELRDFPALVATAIAGLPVAELETFVPQWPSLEANR